MNDFSTLLPAVLHDTVEGAETKFSDLEELFGPKVRKLVEEVTDDKSLPKVVRKQNQIEHARQLSSRAKEIKIADKICNVHDVTHAPPPNWPLERRREYFRWAEKVVEGWRLPPELKEEFLSDMLSIRIGWADAYQKYMERIGTPEKAPQEEVFLPPLPWFLSAFLPCQCPFRSVSYG